MQKIVQGQARALLMAMFEAAVASAQPEQVLAPLLPAPPKGRTIVIGAGKAAASMARALEAAWDGPLEGLVVTRHGYAMPTHAIEVIEASHPLPDEIGMQAAQQMLARVAGLTQDDLVIALFSGGGSALLPLPAPGVSLQDKQQITRALLASGATISEMNCVRRHLSAIKGGRLALACHPARVVTLLISDVPGDAPEDIASGPTVADPTTSAAALAILERYAIDAPASVRTLLISPQSETAKPGDARLARNLTHLIATPQGALEAAAQLARSRGLAAHILSDSLEGEARSVGLALAGLARQVALRNQPFTRPCVLLSGGETTVTLRGQGQGGRNVEFLLALALGLQGLEGVYALAADTDGVDGSIEVAGALYSPDTLARARQAGIDPQASLMNNDAHGFFGSIGDAVVTGPTYTNVNDFRAILIT